jgi:hypothetical protein
MKSEEKLKQLFEAIRNEKTTTDISEVSDWLSKNNAATTGKTAGKFLTTKAILILSSVFICLTALLVFYTVKEPKNAHLKKNRTKEKSSVLYADNVSEKEANENQHTKINEQAENRKSTDTNQKNEPKQALENIVNLELTNNQFTDIFKEILPDAIIPEKKVENMFANPNKSNGLWRAQNDSLKIDTLFSGVKKLLFKGDKCDIKLRGTQRSDISMKYQYQLKAKGVFSKKKEGNCELSYELKDSVLTIHLQRENQKFNGISVLSETSKMEFIVPENIDVKMDSDLGDIDVDGLKNIGTILYSALGDITATNSTGDIDVETALGDISIKNVSGKLKLITSKGDISGEKISISDDCILNSSMGDIDVQLNNPISECKLNLSTSLGKVKMKRADLTTKSRNELKTDSGKFKVNMNTSMGNIIVR